MPDDRIERDIAIAASPRQVWAALTEAGAVSAWLGGGKPAEVELRPGGAMLVDHGAHGALLARFEQVEAPRYLSFRWSQGAAGEEPADGNATLVEFTLAAEGTGTRLTVAESGFAALTLPPAVRRTRQQENAGNWPHALAALRGLAEGCP
jgi:uncharacterized protein YndB with AHSA1/START domain